MKQVCVQVGVMSLRGPDGEFLESVPVYERMSVDAKKQSELKIIKQAAEIFSELAAKETQQNGN